MFTHLPTVTRWTRLIIAFTAILFGATATLIHQIYFSPRAQAASSNIVISQIYGGGGNASAPFRNDFIELFNRGNVAVSLNGWSVQYTSATGTGNFSANTTALSGTLNPGQYYLVQQSSGGSTGVLLPTPDASGSIAMSATGGKVIVANTTTGLACNGGSTACSPAQLANIVDLVGYDGANFFEGAAAAPTLSNTTAALRDDGGCTDTDNNSVDFANAAAPISPGTPNPRNTSSPLNPCTGTPTLSINDVSVTEGNSGTVTATFTVNLSSPAPSDGVTFDIATADGVGATGATVADNDYVAKTLTTQTIPFNTQTYSFDVTVNGDGNFEENENFFVNLSNAIGATILDGQGIGTITNDDCPIATGDIVISQVYGGGGNAGAPFQSDFIELFNRGVTPVNLSGWSVQYQSATGTGAWQVTSLTGSIAPGGYYLVKEDTGTGCSGSPCGASLPTPDATGTIAMAAGAGKVALSGSTTALNGSCPSCAVDMVGYGATASCFEGAGPTGGLTNTTAALRKRGGCFDSNNNNIDFAVSAPNPRNSSSTTNSCAALSLTINQIQGSGATTPYAGQFVSTTGLVTGRKNNGFFMQSLAANVDSDDATSEGIFVFTSSSPAAAVGDAVAVLGTATEFFNLTQIESTLPGDVTVTSSGNTQPAPIQLTTTILNAGGTPDQLERFEGMRMHADSLVSVAPTNEFGETFTVLEGVARPIREPGIEFGLPIPPDPSSLMQDCCIPIFDLNPERIMIDSDGLVGATPISVTSNVTFTNVTGPLDFTFDDYKILPETPPAHSANMSAVPVPTPAAGELTVAGYNIENFNNNATQRQKAALAIRDVLHLPDIVGTIEIFELSGLQALAAEIEAISGVHYEARLIEADGTAGDADQDVGFLIKTSRVQIDSVTQIEKAGCNGQPANCNTYIDPDGNPALLNDRPPLVLRATVDAATLNPRQIIVVVNHLRSFIDIELVTGDGPRVRAKRKAQAEFLADLLQDLQADNPTTSVLSIGDYNAYQFNDGYTDPISVIKGAPTADNEIVVDESPDIVNPNFINLSDGLPPDQRYSFIFEGTPQLIDHFIINTVANSYLQRYHIARNNTDFPEVPGSLFANDATRPERNSDHDMPVGYFKFPKAATTTTVSNASAIFSPSNQTVVLSANVTTAAGTVNEGSVTFTVTTTSNAVVGLPVVANVSGGVATANYVLPGGTTPQALTITAGFSSTDALATSSGTGTLSVSFNICLLYDPTKAVKSGATYPIKIQLCDINGNNVSSPSIVVQAVGVGQISTTAFGEVLSSGNANTDNNFRFDSGSYIYNLKTTGLSSGVYNLYFTAGDDPVVHAVQFQVK